MSTKIIVFIFLSFWVRRLIGKAGPRNSFHMINVWTIKIIGKKWTRKRRRQIYVQDEYENARRVMWTAIKIIKLGELNELAYEDLFCPSILIPL